MPVNQIQCLQIDWLQGAYLDEKAIEEDDQASNMLLVS